MRVAAQWPFLQADYPSQSLCCIKKRGENRAAKKRKGGLYSGNRCCPLCCLTFEGLVINDCWLPYLNVSPQLPGPALIGSGTCRWPSRYRGRPVPRRLLPLRCRHPPACPKWRPNGSPTAPPHPCPPLLCLCKGEEREKRPKRAK